MAKSIDVALNLLSKSIEKAKKDPSYYMDFVKLHKLLFLGQCYMQYMWNKNLFNEQITAENDGPYVEGISRIVNQCGFGEIKNIENLEPGLYPISMLREEACTFILEKYGRYNTDELVKLTKSTKAYQNGRCELEKVIFPWNLETTGKQLTAGLTEHKVYTESEMEILYWLKEDKIRQAVKNEQEAVPQLVKK